jgi:2-polyprenyl-6-methoxyphenol hydroxylase-like FAD-dependent oxidoreductase
MKATIDSDALIVGAGPVGLTLAMDLASRGVNVTVAELRRAGEPPSVKCNSISARSMEIFRRLGVAAKLRGAGLPADYPNDIASRTTATGIELCRISIPSRAERYSATEGPDTSWPTPEPPHRLNQIYFEPILFAHAAAQPRIRILSRTVFEDCTQDVNGVVAALRDADNGERISLTCRFLIGCDGGTSIVRKRIGASFLGTLVVQRVQSTYIRAPALASRLPGKRAWMYFSLNPRRCGTMIAIDGRETWLIHNFLYRDEIEFDSVDRDWAIRTILGVGADFEYDVMAKEDWFARRLVADRFRDRRVFICGDAAHLWIPHGGYGMNAGIADAANLSWMIAATLAGWAPLVILDAYESERRPIADEISRFTTDFALKIIKQRREISAAIELPGPVGDAVRAQLGREAYELDVQQQCCGGLNFGYFYARSPIISYDGMPHPAYTMHDFTPSTVPGCRAPHLWLKERGSLYDALGADYTLVRVDPNVRVSGIVEAAACRGVPLTVIDVGTPDTRALYARKLTLIRPDRHVAWRSDEEPVTPIDLIDLVRGARPIPTDKPR